MDNINIIGNTMENELNIIEQLEKNLEDLVPIQGFGLCIEKRIDSINEGGADFIARVQYQDQRYKLAGEILLRKYMPVFKDKIFKLQSLVEQRQGTSGILVSPYLSKTKRDECKKAGINFIDLSGNVFIKIGGLYVEREGFPNRFPEQRNGRSLFSDKASLVLRTMMLDKIEAWGVRQLASKTALDPGFVSRLARQLEERNYAVRTGSKIRLREPKLILDDWTGEYHYKKNKEYRFFCMAESPEQIMDRIREMHIEDQRKYVLGFHAGASLVAPYAIFNEVHLYVDNHGDIDFFRKKLNLMESEQGANVILAIPYYKHSAFYQKQQVKGLRVASDIQLYLDLYHYPLRGLEQAEHIYEKRLKPLVTADG